MSVYAKYLQQCFTKWLLLMKLQGNGCQKRWKNSTQELLQFNLMFSAINCIRQWMQKIKIIAKTEKSLNVFSDF